MENINWIYSYMLTGSLLGTDGTLDAQRLIVDIGKLDHDIEIEPSIMLLERSSRELNACEWREFDWKINRKKGAKVVFERKGSTKPKLQPRDAQLLIALAGPWWTLKRWGILWCLVGIAAEP
ncbi:hypothetical protein NX059_009672 [Plenodomus lindquistii]|nr:hypothetical protein NX059_009672 [Plenodomus lindquistii]